MTLFFGRRPPARMPAPPPPDQLFQAALAAHQAGDVRSAADLYRQVLARQPGHLFAQHYLGVALHQGGQAAEALPLLQASTARQPGNPGFLVNLANVLKDLGRLADAEANYLRALGINPQLAAAAFNLGQVRELRGDLAAASEAYRAAGALPPALERLAVLEVVSNPAAAIALFRRAHPGTPTDNAAHEAGLLEQAIPLLAHAGQTDRCATALERCCDLLRPAGGERLVKLALALVREEATDAAARAFLAAMRQGEGSGRAAAGYAVLRNAAGQPAAAAAFLQPLVADGLDHPLVWKALSDSLKGLGDQAGATDAGNRGLRQTPADFATRSSLLLLDLCRTDRPPTALRPAVEDFGRAVAAHCPPRPPLAIRRARGDRLRIGILSPDLGLHPVGKFIVNFFRHGNDGATDLLVYDDAPRASDDAIARDIRAGSRHYAQCGGWSDEQLATRIAADQLDLLLDLAGHTPHNRLPMLSWRVAPAQASYLGYAGTTGAPGVDFRFADAFTEPPGAEAASSERLVRLAGSYFCYDPGPFLPPCSPLPAIKTGQVTFGCFVQLVKVTTQTIRLWLQVLEAVPGSRMLLRCRSFADPDACRLFAARIAELGGDPRRFALLPWVAREQHLALYAEVDIGLNTFPFQQATNLCDALWMGVPCLSLLGAEHQSRMAASIAAAANLPGLCFDRATDLTAAAIALSRDPAGLARQRATMRAAVSASPLADGADFARRLRQAIRSVV